MKYDQKAVSVSIGKFLRDKRKQLKLTQEQLAYRSGLDTSTISRLERGAYSLAINKLPQLVEGYGLSSISELFEGYRYHSPQPPGSTK